MSNLIKIKNLNNLNALQNHEENEIVFCEENSKYYTWQEADGWQEVNIKTDGFKMSLYELNQNIINQMPKMTKEEIKEKLDDCQKKDCKYFMLLCKEYNYYTIFAKQALYTNSLKDVLFEIITELGEIYSIEKTEDEAYEIWIKPIEKENPLAFYFFSYDEGVVHFG